MCLIAIEYRTISGWPVLLAANREEHFGRSTLPPATHLPENDSAALGVVCGTDLRAGGTWLGVNEKGVLVTVTNRYDHPPPDGAPSRGTLCRALLDAPTAEDAARRAEEELSTRRYAGANFVCLDASRGFVVQAGAAVQTIELSPGLHLLANGDLNDRADLRQSYFRELYAARAVRGSDDFFAAAAEICATGFDASGERTIVLRGDDRGTVSSTLIGVGDDPGRAVYRYAAGPPDQEPYRDHSEDLRRLLRDDGA